MKILTLHTDYIKFRPLKKALKSMKDLKEKEKKEQEVKEALVVLTAVEKTDADVKAAVKELVKQVKDIASQVKTKNIVLYPYAHLSSNLSKPDTAVKVLDEAEKALKKQKFKVFKAPFGYYKEFEMKVKGHPLSELSREIVLKGNDVESEKGEEEKYDPKQLLNEISKAKLDTSKLKKNDHRIIGKQMDLFSFNDVAPGMAFFHNNGLIIYNELVEFWRELHRKYNYLEISTPQVLDKRLWQISGHWEKYKDNIFLTDYEGRDFAVKPMNCPGGLLVFKTDSKSYRDLPLRVAELGTVHRQELSGVLAGLFRVIRFTQDDGHVFCRNEKQLESELIEVMKMVDEIYSKFGFKYNVELSTRPEKRIGSDAMWDKAEKALENVLKKQKKKYKINKGDGAFYGPKIDFHLKDSLGRTWQCGTIQVDFAMPERFEIEYTDEDNKKKRPIMIHRAIYGSLERFIGILIEHFNGRFPVWLAPVQVRVLNFTDRNTKTAEKVLKKIQSEIPNVRIDSDFSNSTMSSKVKNAELMRIPYIITIGDKEEKAGTIAVRSKGKKKISSEKVDDFISKLRKEIWERR
ncbi:threonine--tRNA ligase [Candidatus Pacearchaeota archaeon]|nr:threonine--tRNA ligase [Candidatus Pacearchaeota archaeon]